MTYRAANIAMEPTFWTGLGSGLLALGALGFSLWQYRKTNKRLDAVERNEHRQAERRQAEAVTAWFEFPNLAVVRNSGGAVIYEVVVALRNANHIEESLGPVVKPWVVVTQLVPPGKEARIELPGGWGGMSFKPAIEAAFRDAAGIWWVRGHRGTLSELQGDPYGRYGLMLPLSYAQVEYST